MLILENTNKKINENVLMTDLISISQDGDGETQHLPDVNATSREAKRKQTLNSGK